MRGALLAASLLLPSVALADAPPRATELSHRRLALVALGVPPGEPSLLQGERAEHRCAGGEPALCDVAEAAYALAAARVELGEALVAVAALGLTPPPPAPPERLPDETLPRLRAESAIVRGRVDQLRALLEAHAVPVDRAAPAVLAARLAAEASARAASDDDAYRARRGRTGARDALQREAATTLERGLSARIDAVRDPELAQRVRTALEHARGIEAVDARLDALLDVDAMLVAATRAAPAIAPAAPPAPASP